MVVYTVALSYVLLLLCFLLYRHIINRINEIFIFKEVDTHLKKGLQQREKPVASKRQALKDALVKGKKHLLPKKCTEGFVDKAPDEAIKKNT